MTRILGLLAMLSGLLFVAPAEAQSQRKGKHALEKIKNTIQGSVLDYTNNHGADHRIDSPALEEKRDLYIYLPPNYDPGQKYPLLLWLHGFAQDELAFLHTVVPALDAAIVAGILPPLIAAAPDGSLGGRPTLFRPGSFFLNNQAGKYEDYLMGDVWNFIGKQFPILPEREAHVIAGISMGGSAAYTKAFEFPERFATVMGVLPPLNLRWVDCQGYYMSHFDPDCWGWRTNFRNPFDVVARFGFIKIRQGKIVGPLYRGLSNEQITAEVSAHNPIELLEKNDIRPGQFAMYVGYVGKDEFNINTQVESFLHRAKQRGLCVDVTYHPDGHHTGKSATEFYPDMIQWLGKKLARYKTQACENPGRDTPSR